MQNFKDILKNGIEYACEEMFELDERDLYTLIDETIDCIKEQFSSEQLIKPNYRNAEAMTRVGLVKTINFLWEIDPDNAEYFITEVEKYIEQHYVFSTGKTIKPAK